MLSGRIAGGASDALDEVILQALTQKKFEEQLRAQQAQEAIQQQRLAQDASQHTDLMGVRQRQLDQADTARRDEANRFGVADMLNQRKLMDAEGASAAENAQFQSFLGDESIPAPVRQAGRISKITGRSVSPSDLEDPQAKVQRELSEYEEKRKLDLRYRPPAAESAAGKQWVMRDGQPVYDTPRPGDRPHERSGEAQAVAQRRQRMAGALGFMDRLDDLREKINTKMGPEQRLGGVMRRGVAMAGLDPDVAQYERERMAAGRALAVAIMGAQNLSDADAKVWADMLPDATTDRETARRLMDSVRQMVSGGESPQSPGPSPTPSHEPTAGGAGKPRGVYVPGRGIVRQ